MKVCTFSIKCMGRKERGFPALEEPVDVRVDVYQQTDSDSLHISVDCVHNTGSHGQRCMASYPGQEKVGEGVRCPYSVDIPYYHDLRIVLTPRGLPEKKEVKRKAERVLSTESLGAYLYCLKCRVRVDTKMKCPKCKEVFE